MIVRKLVKVSFPAVPAGQSRRGAITSQQVEITEPDEPVKETPKPQRQLAYALVKPRAVEGYVTLTQLAAERGMQSQLARLYMQRAGINKPVEGWRWKTGSKRLGKIRRALGLRP